MCGIIGLIANCSRPENDLRALGNSALQRIAYRGPDASDLYCGSGVLLGNVRLAIIDQAGGGQPMLDPESGVRIVFNGMIYNYLELRQELQESGYAFQTQSDTEVLLKAYLHYGEEVVKHLNGMYAFAAYHPDNRRLFCARDPLGIKPLYYKYDGETLIFASEIKALIALRGEAVEYDPQAISDYIHLQYALGEKTFIKGVRKLLPGHCLRFDGKSFATWVYWEPNPDSSYRGSFPQAADELRALLDDAVRLQIRSDVPVGAHLSGGLDTGTVSALAAQKLPQGLHTFTAAFNDGGIFDDSAYAQITAKYIGSEHHLSYPDHRDFAILYEQLAYHLDEPVAAPGVFPQYIVSKLAKERVTVVLGGQGADEIFGGYARYYLLLLDQAIRCGAEQGKENLGISWEELGTSLGQLNQYGSLWQKIQANGAFEAPIKRYWTLIDRSEGLIQYLTPEFESCLNGYRTFDEFVPYLMRYRDAELLNLVLYYETTNWLPALLQVEDRMSMACSLESRVPILDRRIVDFAFSLPTSIKMRGGRTKAIMRAAFDDLLAPAIRDRRDKVGFPVPVNRWFRGPLREYLADILGSKAARERGIFSGDRLRQIVDTPASDHDRALWGMLNLEIWFRNFVDRRN